MLVRKKHRRTRLGLGQLLHRHGVVGASIDVETSASPYEDERTPGQPCRSTSCTANPPTALGYVNSDESDYQAKTLVADVSHDMFGDLTTISLLGYKNGQERTCSAT